MPGEDLSQIPTLADGVVVLNGYTLDDVAAHLAGEDEETARRFGWYPERSTPETVRAAILAWQADWATQAARRTFAVREAATGRLVGGCEIRLKEDGIAHLSWWTGASFRGRGFASRAARLACAYAFGVLGVERLEVHVEPDNQASRGVARKAGFLQEGILRKLGRFGDERRDMVLLARLATDPSIEDS
ncbi:MAG TPA: GNAT family protein [Chloroflexota bacterium]|nr:GNAT family protein [Chloroflexota bacterium]